MYFRRVQATAAISRQQKIPIIYLNLKSESLGTISIQPHFPKCHVYDLFNFTFNEIQRYYDVLRPNFNNQELRGKTAQEILKSYEKLIVFAQKGNLGLLFMKDHINSKVCDFCKNKFRMTNTDSPFEKQTIMLKQCSKLLRSLGKTLMKFQWYEKLVLNFFIRQVNRHIQQKDRERLKTRIESKRWSTSSHSSRMKKLICKSGNQLASVIVNTFNDDFQ